MSAGTRAPTQICQARPDFALTEAARSALSREYARRGPQAVVLSWPSGVTYLPERQFRRGDHDVVLEKFAGCTVYTDSRALALFLDRRVVVDLGSGRRGSPRPVLKARTAVDEHTCAEHCAHAPGPDAYLPELNAAALTVVDELGRLFGGRVSESVLWAYARAALAELKDAGTVDSLPAAALRLVRNRLGQIAPARRTAAEA